MVSLATLATCHICKYISFFTFFVFQGKRHVPTFFPKRMPWISYPSVNDYFIIT